MTRLVKIPDGVPKRWLIEIDIAGMSEDRRFKIAAERVLLASKRMAESVIFGGFPALSSVYRLKLVALARRLGLCAGLSLDFESANQLNEADLLFENGLSFVSLRIGLSGDGDLGKAAEWIFEHEKYIDKEIECVGCIGKNSMDNARKLVDFAYEHSPMRLVLSNADPGASIDELRQVAEQVARLIIKHETTGNRSISLWHSGFPPCILPSFKRSNLDISELKRYDPWSNQLEEVPATCGNCSEFDECMGEAPDISLLKNSISPLPFPISNSFAYRPEKLIVNFDPIHCPILEGKLEIEDGQRKILLKDRDGARLYRTDTEDFSESEIARIKRELGQVYLDVSQDLYHQDFERDFEKLILNPICRECENLEECPALYSREKSNKFRESELAVEAIMERLEGRVLDVGGGPLRYGELFSFLISKACISYEVVEPHPPEQLCRFLEANGIEDRLYRGFAEDFPLEEAAYDWILVLRSHNHFRQPDRAYRNLCKGLKEGGRLLAVDNCAFGLLRSESTWLKMGNGSEEGPHFEHYQNHDSNQAKAIIENTGMKTVLEEPVTKLGANQWVLMFRKG